MEKENVPQTTSTIRFRVPRNWQDRIDSLKKIDAIERGEISNALRSFIFKFIKEKESLTRDINRPLP
jgi:hypothetical protein